MRSRRCSDGSRASTTRRPVSARRPKPSPVHPEQLRNAQGVSDDPINTKERRDNEHRVHQSKARPRRNTVCSDITSPQPLPNQVREGSHSSSRSRAEASRPPPHRDATRSTSQRHRRMDRSKDLQRRLRIDPRGIQLREREPRRRQLGRRAPILPNTDTRRPNQRRPYRSQPRGMVRSHPRRRGMARRNLQL